MGESLVPSPLKSTTQQIEAANMSTSKKKKIYKCTCIVDMCAEHEVVRRIRTTNERLAAQEAVKLLMRSGHFHASCIHVEEEKDEVPA